MLILVVDDEESLCELLAEVLSGDYEVIKAFNGKAALELARERKPDIIISDIMMPHMSGVEMLRALRGDSGTEGIPVILLSAAPLRSKVTGASAFLTKPFEIEVLEKVVARVVHDKLVSQEVPPAAPIQMAGYRAAPGIIRRASNS
jgi:CheY-like chemotaxis protein